MAGHTVATIEQLHRAEAFARKTGHKVGDALDIILQRDRDILKAERNGSKAAQAMATWSEVPIHGLIPVDLNAAGMDAQVLPWMEDLLTGKAPAASETQVEAEVVGYLRILGATFPHNLLIQAEIPDGQILIHRTSQSQRPRGMTRGIADLSITRYKVWPGWYGIELKARGKNGKISSKAKTYPEQLLQAQFGVSTLAWHVAQVAVLVWTLDNHFRNKQPAK